MKITTDTLIDIEAIRRTIASYSQLLDDAAFDDWGALFVDDAEFCSLPGSHLPGGAPGTTIVGRAAIVAAVTEVQHKLKRDGAVIHFGSAPLIDIDGVRARASWDFVIVYDRPAGAAIAFAGRYQATLVKQESVWRFDRRTSYAAGHPRPPLGLFGK